MSTPPGEPPYEQYDPGQPRLQPPPAWGGGPAAPPPTNGKATGALVASVLGFFCGVGFVVGLILGYSARNEIRASGGQQGGDQIATAAIVIGWIGVALTVLAIVGAILLFAGLVAVGGAT